MVTERRVLIALIAYVVFYLLTMMNIITLAW
jgi:hypothetical protein